jgi:DNA-binding CsgD family transcriptional regulator
MVPDLSAERLSDLIGSIYDCAIDPERWPTAIAKICEVTECVSGTIGVYALKPPSLRIQKYWNYEQHWIDCAPQYASEVAEIFSKGIELLSSFPLNELPPPEGPYVTSRHPRPDLVENSRFTREWRRPQGLVDSLQLMVLREPSRLGTLGINRHETVGLATDREITILRLLLPHVSRAVRISDLLDMKTLEATALSATLDSFAVAVVLVDRHAKIAHANDPAQAMIRQGIPIRSVGGRLATATAAGSSELLRAIEMAARDEVQIGATGIGIRLNSDHQAAAIAHVLPLAQGSVRTRLLPGAAAAVFVTVADGRPPLGVGAVAQTFGLTKAEGRVLELFVEGHTLANVAAKLEIAETTAKTHLMRIFSKTGVSRQADLIRLVMSLVPPLKTR